MKTITYNPETHVLVPREPNYFELQETADVYGLHFNKFCAAYKEAVLRVAAAAPLPEPVESEPAMWVMKHIRSGDLAQAKPNQKALHPYMWSDAFPLHTTPQPDRTAELEQLRQRVAELEKERDAALETIKQQHRIHVELVEEKEVAEAKADEEQKHSCKMAYQRDIANVEIATLKSALKVARDGIDKFLVANDPTEFGCACDLSVGYLCGPCRADMQQEPLKIALAKINEVLKP